MSQSGSDDGRLYGLMLLNSYFANISGRVKLNIELNLWLTASKESKQATFTSATEWQIAVRGDIWLALHYVKSINVYFLNQIRYFSIK